MNLYPEIEPFEAFHFPVTCGHELYVERVGGKGAIPVIVLHGGPGAGASALLRRLFDPSLFSVTLFDQRGALRSRPLGGLDGNTTSDLVEDIVRIREHLGVPRWLVAGGSWGATLALAYAAREPERVAGLLLRGTYLGRRREDLWQYQHGACRILPDAWEEFLAPIPQWERTDLLSAYYKRLMAGDPAIQLDAARAFLLWGVRTNTFLPDVDAETLIAADFAAPFVVAAARIAAHYAVNKSFLADDDGLLQLVAALPPVRTILLHGRYDLAVPLRSAFDLKRVLPWAELRIVEAAGHAISEPAMAKAMTAATKEMADAFASA